MGGGVIPIWSQLRRLNLTDTLSGMFINNAEFQIKFKPSKKYKKGTVSFHINWKDSCSLNNIDELNIKARAVLKKSGLDCGFSN